ncbi:MAG: biotin-dependent carboxyltransferase family protein [Rhodospirillales bacterium]|nr:biotin-dependent carboxyltransferase family protein [Rhodospirillales bacterium]
MIDGIAMSNSIRVLEPGLQTCIQDYPGRIGYWRVGIPLSGPMDAIAFKLANLLVGNPASAAALEVQFVGVKLEFLGDAVIALTGGDWQPLLDDEPIPLWETVSVRSGQILACPWARTGARLYIAIAGGLEAEAILGSKSAFPSGFGGAGPLKADDLLSFGAAAATTECWVKTAARPTYPDEWSVEVTVGPHFDWLDSNGQETLLDGPWKITGRSDRTGMRLKGPQLTFSSRALDKDPQHGPDPTNVVSAGYPLGAVNLCGDTPIILPADAPTMGGFINPVVVVSASLWKIGQARPGQTLRFKLIGIEEAIELRRQFEELTSPASIETVAARSGEHDADCDGGTEDA